MIQIHTKIKEMCCISCKKENMLEFSFSQLTRVQQHVWILRWDILVVSQPEPACSNLIIKTRRNNSYKIRRFNYITTQMKTFPLSVSKSFLFIWQPFRKVERCN